MKWQDARTSLGNAACPQYWGRFDGSLIELAQWQGQLIRRRGEGEPLTSRPWLLNCGGTATVPLPFDPPHVKLRDLCWLISFGNQDVRMILNPELSNDVKTSALNLTKLTIGSAMSDHRRPTMYIYIYAPGKRVICASIDSTNVNTLSLASLTLHNLTATYCYFVW